MEWSAMEQPSAFRAPKSVQKRTPGARTGRSGFCDGDAELGVFLVNVLTALA
jgi:hypothetical protein